MNLTAPEILWHVNKVMDSPIERHNVGSYVGAKFEHTLGKDGFKMLPDAFTQDQINEMRTYFSARPIFDTDGCVNHVLVHDVIACEGVVPAIVQHASLAKAYLGCEPILGAAACFWTLPQGEETGLNTWHRDRDDFRALKIFVYLTPVDEETGPHQFIPGTHQHGGPPEFYKGNCRDRAHQIQKHYEADIHSFTGPAGLTWAENTYGLHRGLRPVSKPRCVLEFLYTQNAYPEHRKRFEDIRIIPPEGAEYLFQHIA